MKICKTILDVRSNAEFEDGHVAQSINIPLDEVMSRIDEISALPGPILVCCGSGQRASVVTDYLQQRQVDCWNGGGWEEVRSSIQKQELCLKQ